MNIKFNFLLFFGAILLSLLTSNKLAAQTPVTFSLDLNSLDSNSGINVVTYPDFSIQVKGWTDSSDSVDSDLKNKGFNTVLTNVNPSNSASSAFGYGNIEVFDGLMTEIKFQYGGRGDLHSSTRGGFTGFTHSENFGVATSASGLGTVGDVTNEGGVFKQFAVNQQQPTGPAALRPIYTNTQIGSATTKFNDFSWTTGTQFENPSNITRPGHAEIADIEITVIPAKDILKDSINQPIPTIPLAPATRMELTFNPDAPLKDLERALQIDHFNWFQQVTHIPDNWVAVVVKSNDGFNTSTIVPNDDFTSAVNSLLVASNKSNLIGLIDTIPQVLDKEAKYAFQTDVLVDGKIILDSWVQDWSDGALPYFNESQGKFDRGTTTWALPTVSDASVTDYTSDSVKFYDAPFSKVFNPNDPNDFFGFQTELVGVRADGTIRFLAEEFPGIGLIWKWNSNTLTANSAGGASSLDGQYLSGGIFNVKSDLIPSAVVPLPGAFWLFGSSLILGSVVSRRKV